MPATEQVAKTASLDPNAPDPNVIIPDHVREASSAADKLHEQFYPKNPDQPAAPAKEALPQPAQPEPLHTPAAQDPPVQQQPAAQEQHPAPTAEDQNVTADEWRHRYLSMQGRYQAQVRSNAGMEEQMRQLAQELTRTQALLSQPQAQPQPAPRGNEQLITDEDRANYGEELIDLSRRAAREAIGPQMHALQEENARLTKQVSNSSRRDLFATLDSAIPNWRQVNVSTQFKSWLRLPNIYTGALRGNMLKAAVDGAEAPKVIALFKDFLAEATATGQTVPAAQQEQQVQQPAPREAALSLEALAAPGRARPASGDTQAPAEKPIYSRADISKFFDEKRRGLWAHRAAEAQAVENDLSAAQREGRIR